MGIGFVAGQNSIFQSLHGASTDGGVSWALQAFYFDKNESSGTDLFFFDQNTGVVSGMVFDGRGAIARTTDGGMNWSTLFFDQAIQGLDFPLPTSGFAAGWGGRISHSTDAGITWTDQTRFLRKRRVARDRSRRQRYNSFDGKRRRTGIDTDAYSNSYAQRDTTRYSYSNSSSHTAASPLYPFSASTLSNR